MRIKLKHTLSMAYGAKRKCSGDIVDLEPGQAQAVISAGYADEVKPAASRRRTKK